MSRASDGAEIGPQGRPPGDEASAGPSLARVLWAAAAALTAFAVCVAGSVFQQAGRVARVDDVSVWRALHRRWHMVVTSWQSSLTARDWLLFAGVSALAAAAVATQPALGRVARARRRAQ